MEEIKLILLGESGVGKTSIMMRFAKNKYDDLKNSTICIEYATKILEYKGKSYNIQLLDTVGQEKYRSIINSYYHLGNGFFIVFDLTDEHSLNSVHYWIEDIKEKCKDPDPIIIILGNKSDLINIKISDDIINKELECCKNKIYIETSAKDNINITTAFEQMIDLIEKDNNLKSDNNTFALSKKKNSKKHKNKNIQCC